MQFERAAKIYKQTNISTMSALDYTLSLLNECLKCVENALLHKEDLQHIKKAHDMLFELMTVTNKTHDGGKRLFHFYVHLNQRLVQYQIEKEENHLHEVILFLEEMIASWESTKPVRKKPSYQRHDLTT